MADKTKLNIYLLTSDSATPPASFYFAVNFNFMFRVHANDKGSEMGQRALEMTCHTLKMMGKGGIHDHVAQVNTMWCSLQLNKRRKNYNFVTQKSNEIY